MSNINDHFFNGPYRELWRRTIMPGLTEAECDFIMELGAVSAGSAVLDLMCGYGRHALELGRRGLVVTAVDNDPVYIEEVQAAALAGSLQVQALCMPVLNWKPGSTYDLVVCMGNSFNFFSKPEAASLLASMAASLRAGGRLIIGSWTIAEIAYRHFREREWTELEGYRYLIANRWMQGPSRIASEHILINADQQVHSLQGVDYIYSLNEMEQLFQEAGLRVEGVYSTPRKRVFRIGDNAAYLVASKD